MAQQTNTRLDPARTKWLNDPANYHLINFEDKCQHAAYHEGMKNVPGDILQFQSNPYPQGTAANRFWTSGARQAFYGRV